MDSLNDLKLQIERIVAEVYDIIQRFEIEIASRQKTDSFGQIKEIETTIARLKRSGLSVPEELIQLKLKLMLAAENQDEIISIYHKFLDYIHEATTKKSKNTVMVERKLPTKGYANQKIPDSLMDKIMEKDISILDKILNIFTKKIGKEFKREEIIDLVISEYPRTNRTSVIPSDYCYNIVNKGIKFQNHIFEHLESGHYRVLGRGYNYEGPIFWKGKQVGEWKKGRMNQGFGKMLVNNKHI